MCGRNHLWKKNKKTTSLERGPRPRRHAANRLLRAFPTTKPTSSPSIWRRDQPVVSSPQRRMTHRAGPLLEADDPGYITPHTATMERTYLGYNQLPVDHSPKIGPRPRRAARLNPKVCHSHGENKDMKERKEKKARRGKDPSHILSSASGWK